MDITTFWVNAASRGGHEVRMEAKIHRLQAKAHQAQLRQQLREPVGGVQIAVPRRDLPDSEHGTETAQQALLDRGTVNDRVEQADVPGHPGPQDQPGGIDDEPAGSIHGRLTFENCSSHGMWITTL